MARNRLEGMFTEAPMGRTAQPSMATLCVPASFVVCPPCLVQAAWQPIYQAAYERAQAAAAIVAPRRELMFSLN